MITSIYEGLVINNKKTWYFVLDTSRKWYIIRVCNYQLFLVFTNLTKEGEKTWKQ